MAGAAPGDKAGQQEAGGDEGDDAPFQNAKAQAAHAEDMVNMTAIEFEAKYMTHYAAADMQRVLQATSARLMKVKARAQAAAAAESTRQGVVAAVGQAEAARAAATRFAQQAENTQQSRAKLVQMLGKLRSPGRVEQQHGEQGPQGQTTPPEHRKGKSKAVSSAKQTPQGVKRTSPAGGVQQARRRGAGSSSSEQLDAAMGLGDTMDV